MAATSVKAYFGVGDILVFSVTLIISALVGVYFAIKDKKKSINNYYYGGKNMSPLPLGLSMAVTFISAITVMGFPTDLYSYGMVCIWYSFTLIMATVVASLYYIPLLHRLQVKTIYEVLEMRFHHSVRKLASVIEVFNTIIYMGFTIYLPAIALNAVTPLQLNWTIVLTGSICTFYTAIGGMKAVVWTDTFQAVIMFSGSLAAFIRGIVVVGGTDKVWEAVERGGRNNTWEFNPDPTIRTTFWTIMVGFSITQCGAACTNQSVVQRYLSCKTINKARLAAVCALLPKITITLISVLSGAVAYAYFEGCDPVKSGEVEKFDQLMPYMVLNMFSDLPGMAGFYVAAVFSGTLSTVSSGINSLSALILQDFVAEAKPNLSNAMKIKISKLTAVTIGIMVTGMAYIASLMGGTIMSAVLIFRGACGGPVFGLFILTLFLPWTNVKGAMTGTIMGIVISVWMATGAFVYGTSPDRLRKLPTSVENCENSLQIFNSTSQPISTLRNEATTITSETTYPLIYAMSAMYYFTFGALCAVIIGLVTSFITGKSDPRKSDPRLFVPLIDNRFLPEKIRTFFRCGVPEMEREEEKEDNIKSGSILLVDRNECDITK